MFDRLIGNLFTKTERRHAEQFHQSGKAINEKVRLYARIGQALIAAKTAGSDPYAAIEHVLSWERFTASVTEAETLAQPEAFDSLALLDERYASVRKFAPLLLATFGHLPTKVRKLSLVDPGRLISFGRVQVIVSKRVLGGLTLMKIGISANAQGLKGMWRLLSVGKPVLEGPSETKSQFFLREPTQIWGEANRRTPTNSHELCKSL